MSIPDTRGIPRRTHEPDPAARFMGMLKDLRAAVEALQRGSTLRNASVSGGQGLQVLDADGNPVVALSTTDGGGVIALDPGTGTEMARFGPLTHTAPGEYGVEVNAGDAWVRLGYQSTSWDQVAGKPTTYPPGPHQHPGTDITSQVGQAAGSQYAFENNVSGSEFYAVWVGNDGGFHFGRNTSSLKYKQNVRDAGLDPAQVLALRPVLYDRKPRLEYPTDADGNPVPGDPVEVPGPVNEFGLIAEEVAEHLPQIVTTFNGEIDGVRYDLLGVALIPITQQHDQRISDLEDTVAAQAADIAKLKTAVTNLGGTL